MSGTPTAYCRGCKRDQPLGNFGDHTVCKTCAQKLAAKKAEPPSYHDLHITTEQIPRTSIFNLPYKLEVSCTRVGGWQLWDKSKPLDGPLAGEYSPDWLVLDVAGHVIVDSRGAYANCPPAGP